MCAEVGRRLGYAHVMSFDMGGTTAKLGTIDDGEPVVTAAYEVDTINAMQEQRLAAQHSRHRADRDRRGRRQHRAPRWALITVGPRERRRRAGPVCYRRGGTEPTVTDANLVLGYLDADYFKAAP